MAETQAAAEAQPAGGKKEKKGFFYGWWIVIGGFMIMATCYTAFVNCISLFQAQIVGDLGMTIGEYNTGTSLASLISIVGTLIIGVLLDKINARHRGGHHGAGRGHAVRLFCGYGPLAGVRAGRVLGYHHHRGRALVRVGHHHELV